MFRESVNKTIEKYGMNMRGGVILGLSGGADSVALFHYLVETGVKFSCVHVNHGLRSDAAADETFAGELCKRHCVQCTIYRFDVKAYAAQEKFTLEEAGRKLRYESFRAEASKTGAAGIAVAHNQNDNAETILMRILRGTGIAGLSGIALVNGNVIRPLIETDRKYIIRYLEENGYEYRTDQSNFSDEYTRNRLRNHLLPLIRKEYNPEIDAALLRLSELAGQDSAFLEAEAETAFNACKAGDNLLDTDRLLKLPHAVSSRVIRLAVKLFAGIETDISFLHVNMILELAAAGTGKRVNIPHGVTAENSYGKLFIYKEQSQKTVAALPPPCTKRFKRDKIHGKLTVRTRKPGDRIAIKGGSKKLSDFFIDEKIPKSERDKTPVLCDGNGVVWVMPYRAAYGYEAEDGDEYIEVNYPEILNKFK